MINTRKGLSKSIINNYLLSKNNKEGDIDEQFYISPKLSMPTLKNNENLESKTGIGLEIDGVISPNALFGFEINHNSFDYNSPIPLEFKPKANQWKIGANFKYLFKKRFLRPYVGTGLYFNRFKTSVERRVLEEASFMPLYGNFNTPTERIENISDSSTWISGKLLGGVDLELGNSSGLRFGAFYEKSLSSKSNSPLISNTSFEEGLLTKISNSAQSTSIYGVSIGFVFRI